MAKMGKMGRRKRSRLITQGLLTSGKEKRADKQVSESKEPTAVAPRAAKAEPKPAPAAQPEPVASGDAPDLQALADRVKARRRENGWTQADVAKNGGPSTGMLSQIERCLMDSPAEEVLAKLDAALEWPAGTAGSILRGTELVGAN
ncbi:XRE family transcriptional regulator [Nocardia yunnanensis]|uniref:XRE family transcriptional regulator n=1 Tax=Nocardia yunnanensis TaxID=2382165 RepID=A0A386ZGR1_9NOCA|nr:helix-turn-helix domain-containing protein [Nocardia yunnanensis]AYF76738.1 XRE family transcriptional regulator [Nocardia yunnanensis]